MIIGMLNRAVQVHLRMKVTKLDMAVYTMMKAQVLKRPVAGITSWEREGSGDFQHRHIYFFC